jgi:hypothetical protein
MNSIDINNLLLILSKVAVVAMIITVAFSLFHKEYWNNALKIFYNYLVTSLIIALMLQLIFIILFKNQDYFIVVFKKYGLKDMSFISIFSHITIFYFLGEYFTLVLQSNLLTNKIKIIYKFLILACIINYLFIEGYQVQSVFNSITTALFCCILSCIHLWYLFNDLQTKVIINKNPYFWLCLGLLIPNLINLFSYTIGKKLENTDFKLFQISNIFNDSLQILGYFFIAVGFYYARYTKYLPQTTT